MDRIQILDLRFAEFWLDLELNDMTLGSKDSWCTYNSMYVCVCVCVCVFPCIHKFYFSVGECVWWHVSLCVRESLVWTAGVQVFPSSSAITKSISGIIMLCRVCPTVCASVCSASCTWHTHTYTLTHTPPWVHSTLMKWKDDLRPNRWHHYQCDYVTEFGFPSSLSMVSGGLQTICLSVLEDVTANNNNRAAISLPLFCVYQSKLW